MNSQLWKILIVVAVVALALNDGLRWARATVDLHNSTSLVLDAVAGTSKGATTDTIRDQLTTHAATQQIRIVEYLIVPDDSIHIWTEEDVPGTLVLGPAIALSKGVPVTKAFKTMPSVQFDAVEAIK